MKPVEEQTNKNGEHQVGNIRGDKADGETSHGGILWRVNHVWLPFLYDKYTLHALAVDVKLACHFIFTQPRPGN
jgi:hypothetical protein